MEHAAQLAQQPQPQFQPADENDEAPPLIPLQQEPQEEVIINPAGAAHLGAHGVMQDQQEEIIAMDDLTDNDSNGEPPHVALPIPSVEIVPLPDFNNLQSMMPHKVQIEDLMGFDGGNPPQPGPEPVVNQNVQIGLVQIVQPDVDPIFGSLSPIGTLPPLGPSPEAFRYWVKFFSHHSQSTSLVLIPDSWMNFFSFLLLQSPTSDWASNFLQSNAWSFMRSEMSGNATLFSLPRDCPNVALPVCPNFEHSSSVVLEPLEDEQLSDMDGISMVDSTDGLQTPKKPRIKGKGKAPLSENDVRRSTRLKKLHKGFKSSICKDRSCLGCSVTPPTISPKIIKNLGASFCGLNPDDLSPSKLQTKPARKKAVSKKKSKNSNVESSSQEDASLGPQ